MELHKAYEEIRNRIDQIDFSALWAGFTPFRFALYNDRECFLDGQYVEKTDEFFANTAIEYKGEYIAIWDLSGPEEDLDLLTASIAHEMFHAFQKASGESRWADEKAALFDYRYSADNISMKLSEGALIRDILLNGNTASFAELLALRKARAERHRAEYDYEARIEQIEGSANFVELKVLSRLDPEKGTSKWETILSEIADPAAYIPVRIVSYYVGAAFLKCIDICSPMDYYSFDAVPFSVKVIEHIAPTASSHQTDPKVSEIIGSYLESTRRIVQNALSKNEIVLKGSYRLDSLNIWDARWDGRYAISNRFVSYFDGLERKILYGNFVIEMGTDRIIRTVYMQ